MSAVGLALAVVERAHDAGPPLVRRVSSRPATADEAARRGSRGDRRARARGPAPRAGRTRLARRVLEARRSPAYPRPEHDSSGSAMRCRRASCRHGRGERSAYVAGLVPVLGDRERGRVRGQDAGLASSTSAHRAVPRPPCSRPQLAVRRPRGAGRGGSRPRPSRGRWSRIPARTASTRAASSSSGVASTTCSRSPMRRWPSPTAAASTSRRASAESPASRPAATPDAVATSGLPRAATSSSTTNGTPSLSSSIRAATPRQGRTRPGRGAGRAPRPGAVVPGAARSSRVTAPARATYDARAASSAGGAFRVVRAGRSPPRPARRGGSAPRG